jgi:hypothetical protein
MVPKPPTKKTQSNVAPLKEARAGVLEVRLRVASVFQKAVDATECETSRMEGDDVAQ